MKKTITTGITFDASAKTVVHADFSDITIKGIFLITNITDQTIIYNFADTTKGGTLSTDTLTLEYDTTSMDDADDIQIIVDDGSTTQAVSGTVTANLSATDNTVLDNIDTSTAGSATSLAIMDDWDESDRAKVNPIVGQAGVAGGAGSVSALTQRTTLASDDPLITAFNKVNPPVIDKSWSAGGTLVANAVTVVTTAATTRIGAAFTPYELVVTNLSGASAMYVSTYGPSISSSTSTAANNTLTATAHGLPATATAIVFTSVSFTSSPSITTNTVTYYAKQVTDANTLEVYTDSGLSSIVDITSAAASQFFVAPSASNALEVLPATPATFQVASYNTAPVVRLFSAGTPTYQVVLRGT